ncbi:signal peptidase I [Chloroflexota bacterium]
MSEIRFSSKYLKSSGNLSQLSNIKQLELLKYALEQKVSVRMTVYGDSMTPFLRNGDVILLSPLENNPPKIGDILAFEQTGIQKLVIHRIVHIDPEGFEMKGDNHHRSDGIILPRQILGRVINIEHNHKNANIGISRVKSWIAWLSKIDLLRRFQVLLHLPVKRLINFREKLSSIPLFQDMMDRWLPPLEIALTNPEEFSELTSSVSSINLLFPDQLQLETKSLVARKKELVLGYCQFGIFPLTSLPDIQVWVTSLGFNLLYQETGFSKRLILQMLSTARDMKAERIYLGLEKGNQSVIQLFQKLDFSFITEYENFNLQKNDNIPISDQFLIMKKELPEMISMDKQNDKED